MVFVHYFANSQIVPFWNVIFSRVKKFQIKIQLIRIIDERNSMTEIINISILLGGGALGWWSWVSKLEQIQWRPWINSKSIFGRIPNMILTWEIGKGELSTIKKSDKLSLFISTYDFDWRIDIEFVPKSIWNYKFLFTKMVWGTLVFDLQQNKTFVKNIRILFRYGL